MLGSEELPSEVRIKYMLSQIQPGGASVCGNIVSEIFRSKFSFSFLQRFQKGNIFLCKKTKRSNCYFCIKFLSSPWTASLHAVSRFTIKEPSGKVVSPFPRTRWGNPALLPQEDRISLSSKKAPQKYTFISTLTAHIRKTQCLPRKKICSRTSLSSAMRWMGSAVPVAIIPSFIGFTCSVSRFIFT